MSRTLSTCKTYCRRVISWQKLKKQPNQATLAGSHNEDSQSELHPGFKPLGWQKFVGFHGTKSLLLLKDFNTKWNLLCPYRLKAAGYEIATTELLLRNKGFVKWKDMDKIFMDNFDLPPDGPEKSSKAIVEEIYIMESAYLLPVGLQCIGMLTTVKKLVIHGNSRIDMKCMESLFKTYLWEGVEYLELSKLDQFTAEDIVTIASEFRVRLQILVLYDLENVGDVKSLAKVIQISFPELTILTEPQAYPEGLEKRPKKKGFFGLF